MKVYLDNAATTALDPKVIEAMAEVMKKNFGNPSSIHAFGRESRVLIEKARKTVAGCLNVSPAEIFFTSGGTEADNMALKCAVRDLNIRHLITSPIEHHAVLHTAEDLHKQGVALSLVKLEKDGHINLDELEDLMRKNPGSLVSLMHANNELGNLLPIKKVGELCAQYQCIFHSDTVQTIGHYAMDMQQIQVHMAASSAHKFHGPKGAGFIYLSNKVKIKPFISGGAQERNMRGGTENLYGIVGLAAALEIAVKEMEEDQKHIRNLRDRMKRQLMEKIPGVSFNGDVEKGLYTVLNVSFPPSAVSEMLLFKLDIEGIAASGGSACSSGSDAGSHVLKALQTDPERAAVRFSFSKFNTEEEIDFCVEKLEKLFR